MPNLSQYPSLYTTIQKFIILSFFNSSGLCFLEKTFEYGNLLLKNDFFFCIVSGFFLVIFAGFMLHLVQDSLMNRKYCLNEVLQYRVKAEIILLQGDEK